MNVAGLIEGRAFCAEDAAGFAPDDVELSGGTQGHNARTQLVCREVRRSLSEDVENILPVASWQPEKGQYA
jgi:hypothetical protein